MRAWKYAEVTDRFMYVDCWCRAVSIAAHAHQGQQKLEGRSRSSRNKISLVRQQILV